MHCEAGLFICCSKQVLFLHSFEHLGQCGIMDERGKRRRNNQPKIILVCIMAPWGPLCDKFRQWFGLFCFLYSRLLLYRVQARLNHHKPLKNRNSEMSSASNTFTFLKKPKWFYCGISWWRIQQAANGGTYDIGKPRYRESVHGKRLQVQPISKWSSTRQTFATNSFWGLGVVAKSTVPSALVTLETWKTRPFLSPLKTITYTLLFVGRAAVRPWNGRTSCCHLPLLSVQYMATLDGRRGLSNWRGDLVYPMRFPPPKVGPNATRMCFPWIFFQRGSVRKHCTSAI